MFARLVAIDGREIWVSCTPQTPLSEVLRRAMIQMQQEEAGFENIEAEIKDRGFDAEMSKNLADIVRISAQAGKDAAASEIEQLRAEIENQAKALSEVEFERRQLRQIICLASQAIGNGAAVSPECSLQFMAQLPDEIAAYTDKLRRFLKCSRDEGTEAIDRALAAEARLAEAMKVIEPFVALIEAIECTTLHAYSDDETWSLDNGANIVKIGHLRAARAFTNAAKEKT